MAAFMQSAVLILKPKKIKSVTVSIVSPSICREVMGSDAMILVFWMLSFKPAFSLCFCTFIKRLFSSSSLSAIRVVSPREAPAAAKSLQSCLTSCDPIDGSPPGSPVLGILQVRTLEWVAISSSNAWTWKVKVKSPNHFWLLATPWTAAYQASPSMGLSRQKYWSGLPFPLPGDLPDPGIGLKSPASSALTGAFYIEPPGKPHIKPLRNVNIFLDFSERDHQLSAPFLLEAGPAGY